MRSTRELCTAVRRGVTAIRQVTATRGTHVKSTNDGVQQTRNSVAGSRLVTRSSSGLAGSSSSTIQTTTDDVHNSIHSRPVSTHPDTRQVQSATSLSQWVDNEKKWLFPADSRFMKMFNVVKNGANGQGARITYKSKVPITPQMMETALHCLTRKANSFRTCLQYRGDELWVVELMKPDLDFKVLEGVTNVEQELMDLIVQPCQLFEGPLWSARMLLPQEGHQDTNDPYPYTCQLLVSLNHAIHDGVGLYWIIFWMLEMLDKILSGVQINDQPFGILHSGFEYRQEEDKIRKELLKDPLTLRRLLNEQAGKNTIPLIAEAFGLPEDENPVTIPLETEVISGQIMEQLVKKCKSVGVTQNSYVLAAYNVALVELIQEAGLDRDVYNITNIIPINTRRFVTESGFHLGCYSMPLHHTTSTPKDVKNNFWQYAKEIDNSVRGEMKNKKFLTDSVLDMMLQEEGHIIPNTQCDFPPLKYDYTFSNIYGAPMPSSAVGKNIKLDYFCNLNAIEKTSVGSISAMSSHGKEAHIKTCNSSRYMTEETASRWNKIIVRILLHEAM
ncbi:hypothetical protein Pmani_030660 [Petrolisthes manimaculis]|uniref:Condensation domain-containing protein n=1 Tax=Petrolisthes manimaculis TaxID=1843537 RepID=A0AAE1NV61_9EUCA|nr:hypothetical protein Pmani_030660 [Petrolisthes manimaculis]